MLGLSKANNKMAQGLFKMTCQLPACSYLLSPMGAFPRVCFELAYPSTMLKSFMVSGTAGASAPCKARENSSEGNLGFQRAVGRMQHVEKRLLDFLVALLV